MTAIINMMFISTITMIIAIILITRRDSESAGKILTENGFSASSDMDEAVRHAVALAKGEKAA